MSGLVTSAPVCTNTYWILGLSLHLLEKLRGVDVRAQVGIIWVSWTSGHASGEFEFACVFYT